MDKKYDFDDITIIPAIISHINTRKDINILTIDKKLPLIVSPMDTVINETNYKLFLDLGLEVCIPRNMRINDEDVDKCFISYGLEEIETILAFNKKLPNKVLIDVANGHSNRVFTCVKKIKEEYHIELMVGNVANPRTYKEYCKIGVDYVRIGIGAGHACTTSANSSIHYPMASLVKECYDIKSHYNYNTKIVPDGGFKNFDDIIKAIGLGADMVMLGSIVNKSFESCSDFLIKTENGDYLNISNQRSNDIIKENYHDNGIPLYKKFRGMSTKEVQKSWNKKELRTSEGIIIYNKVEYMFSSWLENFKDYLTSCMSYTGDQDIKDFTGNVEFVFITDNAHKRFNK